MAKAAKPITDVAIRRLKRPKSGRPARLYDGHGLFFFRGVHQDSWKLRHRKNGGERWVSLGEYPTMSLKEAREAAEATRVALARGEHERQAVTFEALALLDELEPLTGGDVLVFPGMRSGRPLSNNTLNQALRAMGVDTKTRHCAHGFRAMGRTLLAELGYKPEAIERQLCHKQANDTVAAYARETLLGERTDMMQTWADTLDAWADGADVIPIQRKA